MNDPSAARARMVKRQLRRRGIFDERVLAAMGEIPREAFLPANLASRAYADSALPIDEGQTISQPWIVAAIAQALEIEAGERVLEVGTGSGYSTAVLARLGAVVLSIERHAALAAGARAVLDGLGVENVSIEVGDGGLGAPDRAPFDAIAVHAAVPAEPELLVGQLTDGGRLVAPIAEGGESAGLREILTLIRREGDELSREQIAPVAFVPLFGSGGYAEGS